MTKHRQAEIADAHWLRDYEERHFPDYVIHGPAWRDRRNRQSPEAGIFGGFRRLPGFKTWACGLTMFGLTSVVVLLCAIFTPGLLKG